MVWNCDWLKEEKKRKYLLIPLCSQVLTEDLPNQGKAKTKLIIQYVGIFSINWCFWMALGSRICIVKIVPLFQFINSLAFLLLTFHLSCIYVFGGELFIIYKGSVDGFKLLGRNL